MKGKKGRLREAFAAQSAYFAESGQEIAARNLDLMRTACAIGIFLYLLYYIITVAFFGEWEIHPLYGLYVPVLCGYWWYARQTMHSGKLRVARIQRSVFSLYAVTMAEMILLSVFPHPTVPSVFFPLFLLMGPVLFILPVRWQLLISAAGYAIFAALVLRFKSSSCWPHELFEASTALFLSVVVMVLMTQLRVQGENLKSKYYTLSRQDPLTGLLNKSAGLAMAGNYLVEKKRDEHFAILFVDIDNFKTINDTCGHVEGDRRLKAVGGVLQAICRRDDIVCRFGGDEFMLLLKNLDTPDIAKMRAEAIHRAVRALPAQPGTELTCSIGISYSGPGSLSIEEHVSRADAALYQAKENGKDSCELISW